MTNVRVDIFNGKGNILDSSEKSNQNKDRLFVESVEKAFKVLEAFRSDKVDLSLVEIISRTGLNKSAAQRFTHTLHRLGYLKKDRPRGAIRSRKRSLKVPTIF